MFSLLHASGWFGAALNLFRGDLRRWREDASIITLTEVARRDRWRWLKKLTRRQPPTTANAASTDVVVRRGWTVTVGRGEGPGENAILSNREMWKRLRRSVFRIHAGGGVGRLRRPLCGTAAVFQRRTTGRLLIVATTHMRAGVETQLRVWMRSGQNPRMLGPAARQWLRMVDNLAAEVKMLRVEYPDAEMWVPCDWNVNLSKQWARTLLLQRFAMAGHGDVVVVRTTSPTHKDRYIDGAVTTFRPTQGVAVKAAASDHKAGRWAVHWPLRKKAS